ncbi:MAG: GDSL-type esterase/lipase family protein [Bacilli bacterium]
MKRRYKLLIGFVVVTILIAIIYIVTLDKKIYYLSLGDSLAAGQTPYNTIDKSYGDYVKDYLKKDKTLEFYTKGFAKSGYSSIDLIKDVEENKKIKENGKELTIKNALIKADLVTVSIGANDLFYKLNIGTEFDLDKLNSVYKYIDEVMTDVNKLLYLLRKNCKEEIMVLGFYNPFTSFSHNLATTIEPMIEYGNSKMKSLASKYDMTFVDIHKEFLNNKTYLPDFLEIHATAEGYKAIADDITFLIKEKKLAK